MCNFFTCFSDGKGKVLMVKPEDIATMIVSGNKDKNGNAYTPNSHASYAAFLGIREDDYNKWEYNPETEMLSEDRLRLADDSQKVKAVLKKFFAGKDILAMRNLYGLNSGDRNSGNMNSGNMNSGNMNSGHGNSGNRNSGDRNSGHMNSGNMNSGDRNSGHGNSGDRNSGHGNSGDMNSGDMNSGDRNSGHMNSGDRNSGHGNSGDMNSGDMNSGNRNSGNGNASTTMSFFCAEDHYFMFDKKATKAEAEQAMFWFDLPLCVWVSASDMTDQEKIDNPKFYVAGGYLKTNEYKDAWKLVNKETIDKIKSLPHFDAKVFKKITGLDV